MADQFANPALGISAIMIRHLFPLLVLVNALFGVLSLAYCGALARFYAHRIVVGSSGIGMLIAVYLAIALLSLYVLAWGPAIDIFAQRPPEPMGLAAYLVGAASPAIFFHCLRQALALAGAGRRIREARKAP